MTQQMPWWGTGLPWRDEDPGHRFTEQIIELCEVGPEEAETMRINAELIAERRQEVSHGVVRHAPRWREEVQR